MPAAARAAILFHQELASDDDPELDEWLTRIEDSEALAEDSTPAASGESGGSARGGGP
jgi:hypothetical protein